MFIIVDYGCRKKTRWGVGRGSELFGVPRWGSAATVNDINAFRVIQRLLVA